MPTGEDISTALRALLVWARPTSARLAAVMSLTMVSTRTTVPSLRIGTFRVSVYTRPSPTSLTSSVVIASPVAKTWSYWPNTCSPRNGQASRRLLPTMSGGQPAAT